MHAVYYDTATVFTIRSTPCIVPGGVHDECYVDISIQKLATLSRIEDMS